MNKRSLKWKCCEKDNRKVDEEVGLRMWKRSNIGMEYAKVNLMETLRLRASELVLTTRPLRCSECLLLDFFYLALWQSISKCLRFLCWTELYWPKWWRKVWSWERKGYTKGGESLLPKEKREKTPHEDEARPEIQFYILRKYTLCMKHWLEKLWVWEGSKSYLWGGKSVWDIYFQDGKKVLNMGEWMVSGYQIGGQLYSNVQEEVEGWREELSQVAAVNCLPGEWDEKREVWRVTF